MRVYHSISAGMVKFFQTRTAEERKRSLLSARSSVVFGRRLVTTTLCFVLASSLLVTSSPGSPQAIGGMSRDFQASIGSRTTSSSLSTKLYLGWTGTYARYKNWLSAYTTGAWRKTKPSLNAPQPRQVDPNVDLIPLPSYAAPVFTDDPLGAGVVVQALHITELRSAVNQVRASAGVAAASWDESVAPGGQIRAAHILELRVRLNDARTFLGLLAASYSDPPPVIGGSIRVAHIQEVRDHIKEMLGTLDSNSTIARLDPANRTGGGGEDPLSRNFNWSVPLLGLPGRSGLDLGLSLTYNSLVWTRSGSTMSFDDDRGFPSPGFRLGFPVIQPSYFNFEVGKQAFLLITPSGERIELRQVGSSTLYESADSSHLLLDTAAMVLRTTDGTQLSYVWKGSDYQCTEIKDRNGNFITINYTAFGRIDTVIDTLSRTIKFNYDGSNNLSSITQIWNGQAHTWASFVYTDRTIDTDFSGVSNVGPQDGAIVRLLTQVKLGDNSGFNLDYTSWGQAWKISGFATDGHLLNYRSYKLRGSPLLPGGTENDCPRFTERRDWAKNWNRNSSGSEQEAITQFAVPINETWTPPNSPLQTGMRAEVTLPDGTKHKIYFNGTGATSGWHRGLPSLVETYDSNSDLQRRSVTKWTQDNTNTSYPLNPRVEETNVYDPSGNRRRVTTAYTSATLPNGRSFSLPGVTREWDADATTILRRTETDYRMDPVADDDYLSRNIIGLVKELRRYEAATNTLVSRLGLGYDESAIEGSDMPVQHSAGFLTGRANLTSVRRYDVNTSQVVVSTRKYNSAGSMVETLDPSGHRVQISYADQFAANGTTLDSPRPFATLAYPSRVTDPDDYSSTTRYNYDFGAVTWQQTPQSNTTANIPGPQQKFAYDDKGRIERITSLGNSAYTQFIYGPNYVESFGNVNHVENEVHSLQVFDGAGRVIAKAGNQPDPDIIGLFSGQLIHYDIMGRVMKQSNPTETSIVISGAPILPYTWEPHGADQSTGWLYTRQTYDWKGRPLVTTNTDDTTKTATYSGCGCAGNEAVTLTDEGALVDPVNTKKRQQKVYSDILGRTVKTEVLNWDGVGPFGTQGTVYSSTVNTYNGRDQITQVRQYQGAEGSGTFQDTTMTYDGHGRLKTRHVPQQDAGKNTVWDYNSDDTIQKVTDARTASKTFGYNKRHLVNSISYAWPGGGTVPDPVSFNYDAAGNRISMVDGLGSAVYVYDERSRMTSESRTFAGVGTFNLSYTYNLAGQLTSLTDHLGAQVGYVHDKAGRVTAVTGANFGGVSTYASNIQYRASGALKSLDYGNSRSLSMTYNRRLQPASFSVPGVMSKTYDYQADGRLKFSHDLLNPQFDRSYTHDHAGRITEALSGAEARNEGATNSRPYQESFVYDALGHLTARPINKVWSGQGGTFSPTPQTYVNERNSVWEYDTNGNLTDSGAVDYTIDAAGQTSRNVSVTTFPPDGQPVGIYGSMMDLTQGFDGDGMAVKKLVVETLLDSDPEGNVTTTKTSHLLRSSVLGGKVVAEIGTESEQRGFVYLGGAVLAVQYRTTQTVNWEHRDAGNASVRMTSSNGSDPGVGKAELDPLGSDVGAINTVTPLSPRSWKLTVYPGFGSSAMNSATCMMDFMPTPCSEVARAVNNGSAVHCPNNNCGPRVETNGIERRFVRPGGWVEDKGTPLGPAESDTDVIKTNIDDNGLGHWDPFHFFLEPQDTTFDLPGITKLVDLELADDECAEFANAILNQVSKGKRRNLADTFNAFLDQPKPHDLFTRIAPVGSFGEATSIGKLKNSTARMFLRRDSPFQTVTDADNVIQELFHFAGDSYSDEQLARALRKTPYGADANRAFPDGTANIFDPRYIANDDPKEFGYSTYFHTISHIYCGYRPANLGRRNYRKK